MLSCCIECYSIINRRLNLFVFSTFNHRSLLINLLIDELFSHLKTKKNKQIESDLGDILYDLIDKH